MKMMATMKIKSVKLWQTTIFSRRRKTSQKKKWTARISTKISKSKFLYILLTKQIFRDYEAKGDLDRYEEDGIDDEEQEIIDAEGRRQAERIIDMQNRNT